MTTSKKGDDGWAGKLDGIKQDIVYENKKTGAKKARAKKAGAFADIKKKRLLWLRKEYP